MLVSQTLSKRGMHENNEDFYLHRQIDNLHYIVVSDGCSSASNSEFASRLLVYIMDETIRNYPSRSQSLAEKLDSLMERFLMKLGYVKDLLGLHVTQLEATIGFAIVDEDDLTYVCKFFGDGCIIVDGDVTAIDEENTPNYPIHLYGDYRTDSDIFEKVHTFEGSFDWSFALATDGIDHIVAKETKPPFNYLNIDFPYLFFSKDTSYNTSPIFYKHLHGLVTRSNKDTYGKTLLKDDLTIVRLIVSNEEEHVD